MTKHTTAELFDQIWKATSSERSAAAKAWNGESLSDWKMFARDIDAFDEEERSRIQILVDILNNTSEKQMMELDKMVLEKLGYKVLVSATDDTKDIWNGTIIKNGWFVGCYEYGAHSQMNRHLHELGLLNYSQWTDENSEGIHVSGESTSGSFTNHLEHPEIFDVDEGDVEKRVNTLFEFRHIAQYSYGDNMKTAHLLFKYISGTEKFGGKYNGLAFLRRFYSKLVDLPNFSNQKGEIKGKICIRTSPEKSLPGLLNSSFATFENLLTWFALEETARYFTDGN